MRAVQRHDVRVLQPGQGQVLPAVARRQLEDDRPVGQERLGAEEDPALGAAAQLAQQAQLAQRLADLRVDRANRSRLLQEPVAVEQHGQFGPPLGEAADDLLGDVLLARLLAQADLLVDQPDGGLGVRRQFGMAGQEVLRRGALPLMPGGVHLVQQADGQGLDGILGKRRRGLLGRRRAAHATGNLLGRGGHGLLLVTLVLSP